MCISFHCQEVLSKGDLIETLIVQLHLTEEAFEAFRNDPDLERWYLELPKDSEKDLQRLRRILEVLKEDN